METIPELLYLSNNELKDLINCEDKLNNFVDGLPDIAASMNRCEQLAEENYSLAKENLDMKTDYENIRAETITRVEEFSLLHTSFEKLSRQHQQLSETLAPSSLQEATLIAAAQSEEESEGIAEEFLAKNIEIAPFLCQYLEKRVESHLRKFKGERLASQLRELHKAGF